METRTWAKDSFWENYDQNRITTVLTITHDDGKVTKQQLTVNRYTTEGDNNPDFNEIISEVGEETITQNTNERNKKKEAQRAEEEQRRIEVQKAEELQKLFEAKIQAFEIEDIKNSKNRLLKSKLRKAKNMVEVNIYSMMIVMEELNNEESGTD